jgi:hypothetical protein
MSTCRKIPYPSQERAEEVLGEIWARVKPGRRLECRTYECPDCGHWHLTSKPLHPTVTREAAAS